MLNTYRMNLVAYRPPTLRGKSAGTGILANRSRVPVQALRPSLIGLAKVPVMDLTFEMSDPVLATICMKRQILFSGKKN